MSYASLYPNTSEISTLSKTSAQDVQVLIPDSTGNLYAKNASFGDRHLKQTVEYLRLIRVYENGRYVRDIW
jgi:hypothetical protein